MSPCLVMNIHKYELIYLYEHCRPFDTKLETLIQSYICYGILVCFLFYVPPSKKENSFQKNFHLLHFFKLGPTPFSFSR